MTCNICSHKMRPILRQKILGKHDVQYFRCERCGLIQTEEPFWLEEAYSSPITNADLGLVSRNFEFAQVTKVIISLFFDSGGKLLDYGGGYGLFVRLMRDSGFAAYRSDQYCPNVFAKGFDASDDNDGYELLTAFELFEHLVKPTEEARNLLRSSSNILFSTLLAPTHELPPSDWWYFGLEHGQHVALYTYRSLQIMADNLGLNLVSNGKSLHLFTKKRISSTLFALVSRRKVARLINCFLPNRSLLASDYFNATGMRLP